jgi:hypothetical protein
MHHGLHSSYLKHTYQSMTIFHADILPLMTPIRVTSIPMGATIADDTSTLPLPSTMRCVHGQAHHQYQAQRDNTSDFDIMGGSRSIIISVISVISDGMPAKSTGVYSLDGRYMGNTLEGLPHGVYITNGKKVVR